MDLMDRTRNAVNRLRRAGRYIAPVEEMRPHLWTPATLFNLDDKRKVGLYEVIRASDALEGVTPHGLPKRHEGADPLADPEYPRQFRPWPQMAPDAFVAAYRRAE